MDNQTILIAFLLTLFAGLSTGIGGLIALIAKRTNTNFLSFALGLSAGVMIYVSFMEMLPMSIDALTDVFGEKKGMLYLILSFFGGIASIALIDFLVPKQSNPHEVQGVEDMKKKRTNGLKQTGVVLAVTIAIHNFPEGIATFMSAQASLEVALPITAAIAIHNIPEGIAVSVPIYHATGSKKKAFLISFLSGITEPIGAIVGYLVLRPFFNDTIFGLLFSAVAGIMVFISLEELIPMAHEYEKSKITIIGVIIGMIVMAVSLLLFI